MTPSTRSRSSRRRRVVLEEWPQVTRMFRRTISLPPEAITRTCSLPLTRAPFCSKNYAPRMAALGDDETVVSRREAMLAGGLICRTLAPSPDLTGRSSLAILGCPSAREFRSNRPASARTLGAIRPKNYASKLGALMLGLRRGVTARHERGRKVHARKVRSAQIRLAENRHAHIRAAEFRTVDIRQP